MDQHDETDPFNDLQAWAKATERRVRREGSVRRLRRRVSLLAPIVIVGLLVVSLVPAIRSRMPSGAPAAAGSALPAESVDASGAATVSAVTSASAAPTDPFAGTPAAGYPKGAAGITLPSAKAVPGFTAAQVGTALKQVRGALIAGRLASGMLVGHHPEPFLALFAPNARAQVGKLFKDTGFEGVATWISPSARLDPAEQPRVSGRVSYTSVTVDGLLTLRVTTNFVWVYAFTGGGSNGNRPLAVEHDENRWEFTATHNLRPGDRGMWIAATKSYAAWVDCAAAAKGMLAPTSAGTVTTPDPQNTESLDDYLKPDHTLDIKDDCGKH
jgi:hypothetical protein